MLSRPIQNGRCATRTAQCNSAEKSRSSSRPACSPPTWTITSRQSCARSTRCTMSTAFIPTVGRRLAACLTVTAPSAAKLPPSGTPGYWRVFTDRVLELWKRYDAIAKEKKQDSFFFANSGGNVRGGPNLDRLGKVAAWFQADNQGRT